MKSSERISFRAIVVKVWPKRLDIKGEVKALRKCCQTKWAFYASVLTFDCARYISFYRLCAISYTLSRIRTFISFSLGIYCKVRSTLLTVRRALYKAHWEGFLLVALMMAYKRAILTQLVEYWFFLFRC